jgi:ATP-binding protein involved in chromosome partitioning
VKIVAVASRKGGVGKSTVSLNLARALADSGRVVGLLGEVPLDPAYPRLNGVPPAFAGIAVRVEHALA